MFQNNMIDIKFHNNLRTKYSPDGSSLRKAQLRMVEMLKFIDTICKENGLKYWLSFGTLLGAVRHGGFIPWDDDTDICMPIEDLRKFKEIMLRNNLSKEFVLQCHESDPGYNRSEWAVLRDLKSEYIQDNRFHNNLMYRGLQVDIFPVERSLSLKLKFVIDNLQYYFINMPTLSNNWYAKLLKPFRGIMWMCLNYIAIPLCRRYKNKRTEDIFVVSYGVVIPFKLLGDVNGIFPLRRISFEDLEFNAPNDYMGYLTNLYGDWRKIPSYSEIKTHNAKFIFK